MPNITSLIHWVTALSPKLIDVLLLNSLLRQGRRRSAKIAEFGNATAPPFLLRLYRNIFHNFPCHSLLLQIKPIKRTR